MQKIISLYNDMKKFVYSLNEVAKIGQKIIDIVPSKALCFHGKMGAGKTTLIKYIVKKLGEVEIVNSPTFGIVNEYHYPNGEVLGYHFDFYRLEDEIEALDLGLEDYLYSGKWVFMEWADKIASYIPEDAVHIYIEVIDEHTRSIQLKTS